MGELLVIPSNIFYLICFIIPSGALLVITCEEVAVTSPVEVGPDVQQPLDDGRILGHSGHVEDVLSVIFLGQINIVEKQWVMFQ